MTNSFTLTLECGHTAYWKEPPGSGGGPFVGLVVFCQECGEDQEIVQVFPEIYEIEIVPIEDPDFQIPISDGTHDRSVHLIYDGKTGTYGYYYSARNRWGHYLISNRATVGFPDVEEARADALSDKRSPE